MADTGKDDKENKCCGAVCLSFPIVSSGIDSEIELGK